MAHHSDQPFDGDPEAFRALNEAKQAMDLIQKRQQLTRDLLDTTEFRGALGAYPEGKLTPSDEGAIQFAVGEQDGKVVLRSRNPRQIFQMGVVPVSVPMRRMELRRAGTNKGLKDQGVYRAHGSLSAEPKRHARIPAPQIRLQRLRRADSLYGAKVRHLVDALEARDSLPSFHSRRIA